MLNERIESCSEIADLEGLYFVWTTLLQGVVSIQSLTDLRLHYKGKLNLNIDYTILLFEQLELVKFDGNEISISINRENTFIDIYNYQDWFSKILLNFLIKQDIILLDDIKYDDQNGKYVLPRHNIKYKYACYRNLLITLRILEKCEAGNYYINELLSDLLEKVNSRKLKLTEEALLKKLELQRLQGEKGELFVVNYEKIRLKTRQDTSEIKRISILDVTAGYDIVSFNDMASITLDRFIEVKAYKGKPHFYWSANEIQTAKIKSENYFLYLVDVFKVSDSNYNPIIICDPVSYFANNQEWFSKPQSYLFEKII
ncbi:putative protein DUF3883 [Leeuwenhoekiella aestuarii]|uniref:DUF3883 domain-containing protein n=1 Tax=Leeuwenhoekiella aestuarii TaxID=2249426 RepID=UPI000FFF20E4|nr:DUF3883 domain-containing protein [Leeuwenhoekiella aestuarii]RXG19120.1 putative protein DUF3883 [Leeuwenhoekiella aestuarii]